MPPFGNFFIGRYGYDQFTLFLVACNFILGFISRIFMLPAVSLFAGALFIFALFRVFSRNIERRRRENEIFMRFWFPAKGWFAGLRRRTPVSGSPPPPEGDNYKFFKCPGCKNRLRVPWGQGRIFITCPKCGERFKGKT